MRNIDIYPQDKIYSDLVGVWYPAASAGADDEPPVPPVPTLQVNLTAVKLIGNQNIACFVRPVDCQAQWEFVGNAPESYHATIEFDNYVCEATCDYTNPHDTGVYEIPFDDGSFNPEPYEGWYATYNPTWVIDGIPTTATLKIYVDSELVATSTTTNITCELLPELFTITNGNVTRTESDCSITFESDLNFANLESGWHGVVETMNVSFDINNVINNTNITIEHTTASWYPDRQLVLQVSVYDSNNEKKYESSALFTMTPIVNTNYFYLENRVNSNSIKIIKTGNPSTGYDLQYSTNGLDWTNVPFGNKINFGSSAIGSKIYLRSTTGFSQDASNYYKISYGQYSNYYFRAGGDIRTLIDYTNMTNTAQSYAFYNMFQSCSALNGVSSDLLSNITVLNNNCYQRMFYGCTYLTNLPTLPATTLASQCYKEMFYGCTRLNTFNITLPATVMTANCYERMFYGCTTLTQQIPMSPTTLASGCFKEMYRGCTALTNVSNLNISTLTNNCYEGMFYGCTSLTSMNIGATTLAEDALDNMFNGCSQLNTITTATSEWDENYATNWVQNVAASGTFNNNGCATIPTGVNGIPANWTEVKSNCPEPPTPPTPPMPTPPTPTEGFFYIENTHDGGNNITLTATDNPQSMSFIEYSRDGEGWEPVNFEPTAENLAVFAVNLDNPGDKVYFRSAQGWSDTYAPDEAHTGYYYFNGDQPHKCGGDIRTLYDWTRDDVNEVNADCFFGLFQADNNLTDASELNLSHITTMSANCYMAMFGSCTSLTAAPNIYATPSATDCYSSMFRNCRTLDTIYSLATSWDAQNTSGWLGETTGGTVYNIGGASGIEVPNNWTVVSE